ncbi:MAG TPA: MTH938/NDUFAF3 family protein [Candidatus Bathyarchaeia archaeon]|nr:MTH938/NDUFAF3 family protein [Candidatus Bathyarchaeia archaeon]
MKIENTKFGSITIDGKIYKYDIYINTDGTIIKRKKELSKPISKGHTVLGPEELNLILKQKPETLVIGQGQRGILPMPEESKLILEKTRTIIIIDKTPVVIHLLNSLFEKKANVAAILHITC